jgi:hypothetical protein
VPLEHDALGDRLAHFGHCDLQGRRLRHFSTQSMKPGPSASPCPSHEIWVPRNSGAKKGR